jgi:MFS family permease
MTIKQPEKASIGWRNLPRSVWALGFVSLLMDISSELIHSLLPVFLVTVIGTSTVTVGLIEGIGEATAAIAKLFSGVLSDRLGRRKLLAGIGYGLSALTKPMFPLATTAGEVLTARFIDRIGKGIRGAPRDALVADVTPEAVRGAAFGVRQALDTVGAFAGPLLAMLLMVLYANNFRAVFWWALVPAALCVLLIIFGVQEPGRVKRSGNRSWPINKAELARLSPRYWLVIGIGIIFALARFSEAFLVLKAQSAGLALALIPLVYVWMNLIYALIAAPAGTLSDRIGRPKVLLAGLGTLVIADLVLAFVPGLAGVFLGVGLWGAYLGQTQGLLPALVADTAPDDLRGTAFGLFNLLSGGTLLIASLLAGWLWDTYGPAATFAVGAAFSAVAATGIAVRMDWHTTAQTPT